mmetsp:Transcript_29665/g.87776  ORF Transcript_29665/g.87776 Transcript_29665/m.87776 type:complete len:222 (+) Transcript_29665:1131-1796(+)
MRAEELVLDDCCQRQEVKKVGQQLPHLGRSIFSQTLLIETIHLGDLAAFMVATDHDHPGWVPDLQGNHHAHGLDRVVSTVHVVTQEQVVGVWSGPSYLENLHQIMELPMCVANYNDRSPNVRHICLLLQQLLALVCKLHHILLAQHFALAKLPNLCIPQHCLLLRQHLGQHDGTLSGLAQQDCCSLRHAFPRSLVAKYQIEGRKESDEPNLLTRFLVFAWS